MSIEIRTFTKEDYAPARGLWEATPGIGLSEADSQDAVEQYLVRNSGLSLVAIAKGSVVGTILVGNDGRRGMLYHLAVAQQYRNQGVGRRLVYTGLSRLARVGITKCHLLVFGKNQAGRAFWQSVGAELRDKLVIYSLVVQDRD